MSNFDQASGIRVVAIGGGTGLSTLLRGLKRISDNVTAVVTVADDGGGSGQLRKDLGMLPPGDIRNCILALANTEPTMERLLNYRFESGSIAGQNFGNLFLAALTGLFGSFDEAVRQLCEVLAVTGRVLPVTEDNVYLMAEFENGKQVLGESNIASFKKQQKCRIASIVLVPSPPVVHPEVLHAIENADLIVLGPGSIYTSVIPNLLVEGVTSAIERSKALKVVICNLMTQEGETEGYSAFDHVNAIVKHSSLSCVDVCITSDSEIHPNVLSRYASESASATQIDKELFEKHGIHLVHRDLATDLEGVVRHDPLRLAAALLEVFLQLRPRSGHLADLDRGTFDWIRTLLPS